MATSASAAAAQESGGGAGGVAPAERAGDDGDLGGATVVVDLADARDVAVPEHREVRVDHLVGGRQVQPDLEQLERVGPVASSSGNISECTMPAPAVSHCTSPRPKRAAAPSESEWSIRPLRTKVTVSKPRCGCCGKPGTTCGRGTCSSRRWPEKSCPSSRPSSGTAGASARRRPGRRRRGGRRTGTGRSSATGRRADRLDHRVVVARPRCGSVLTIRTSGCGDADAAAGVGAVAGLSRAARSSGSIRCARRRPASSSRSSGHDPGDLELVAVGVLAVEATSWCRGRWRRRARRRSASTPRSRSSSARVSTSQARWYSPTVRPAGRRRRRRRSPIANGAEVVVVGRAGGLEEGGPMPGHLVDDPEAERLRRRRPRCARRRGRRARRGSGVGSAWSLQPTCQCNYFHPGRSGTSRAS